MGVSDTFDIDELRSATATAGFILADFKADNRIYDRVALDVLPDLLTQRTTGMARFHARRRVGAGAVRTDVFRKLKTA